MNDQRLIIESLAMDLKRAALGLYKGSPNTAQRFKEEALKREKELESKNPKGYLKKLIQSSKKALTSNENRVAEDALMYSTLFQNYALKKSVGG